MKNFMAEMFGETIASNLTYRQENGREWVMVKEVCALLGILNEYNAVKDGRSRRVFNLTDADKRKFYVPEVRKCPGIWFISESGFWKILGRSRSKRAEKIRSVLYTKIMPISYKKLLVILTTEHAETDERTPSPFIEEFLGHSL